MGKAEEQNDFSFRVAIYARYSSEAQNELSIEDQVKFLKETLDQLPVTERLFGEVHEVYLAHDLTRLAGLRQQYASRDNAQLEEGIMEELVDTRNARMAERMVPYLEQGGTFIAVGALHLPGQGGILQRLRERGYRVTAVY